MLIFNKKFSFGQVFLICTNLIIETSVIDFALVFFYIKNYILNKKIYRKEQYE